MFKYLKTALISHASEVMLKIFQANLHSTWTENSHIYKLAIEQAEETEIKLPTFIGSQRKQRNSRKNLLHWLHESLWLCRSQKTVENS